MASREDDLPGKVLARLARAISEQNMRAIAAIYLNYNLAQLQQYETRINLLTTWKGRDYGNNKQLLIDILFDAKKYKLVDVKIIKKHLGEDAEESGRQVLSQGAVDVDSPLTDSELGLLALPDHMSWAQTRGIAETHLNYTKPKLDSIKETHNNDPWFANFEVLVGWTNLSLQHQRKKLAEILHEAAKEDDLIAEDVIVQTLGVTKEMLGLPPGGAGGATGGGGDVADGRQQQQHQQQQHQPQPPNSSDGRVEYQRVPSGRSGEPKPSGARPAGPTHTQTQHPDPTTDELPLGMLPQNEPLDKKWEQNFDWLNMKKIQEITSKMKTKKPVVVAVLDTGIYEAHEKLKDKILAEKSKCFVKGGLLDDSPSAKDLTVDVSNHGTRVAGVIVLNGPANIKIINLKVLPKPSDVKGKLSDLVRALEHIDSKLPEVDIINMSVGHEEREDDKLESIVDKLSRNRILIASAGNYGSQSSDSVTFPGKLRNVICVGGCDSDGNPTGSSSKGPDVEFLCPGKEVLTINSNKHGGPHMAVDGTSFAAPYACAVAAHVLVAIEAQKKADLLQRMRNTSSMRYLFRSMTDPSKKLAPYPKGFLNLNYLITLCEEAVKGKVIQ